MVTNIDQKTHGLNILRVRTRDSKKPNKIPVGQEEEEDGSHRT
jgi:hypothetical protein